MALANTVAINQVLEDGSSRVMTKHIYHANTAVQEADVLKVNVATLSSRTLILNTTNAAAGMVQYGFVPGEMVTGNTSNAHGFVIGWVPPVGANGGILTVMVANGTFSGTEQVTGDRMKTTMPLASVTDPTHLIHIESIWWSVQGTGKVEVEWGGAGSTYKTAMVLAGEGYWGDNALNGIISNDIASPNGNVYVSTHGLAAGGGYSLILRFQKGAGFAQHPIY